MRESRESCKRFVEIYKDSGVNCTTCMNKKKCDADEKKFDAFDRMMRDAKDIRID